MAVRRDESTSTGKKRRPSTTATLPGSRVPWSSIKDFLTRSSLPVANCTRNKFVSRLRKKQKERGRCISRKLHSYFDDFGWKNMGCGSEILHMITILFMLLSSYNTHILIDGAVLNAAGDFNVHALQPLYLREDNEERTEDHIQKVSGEETEEKGALVVEKFRALLGLKSFHTRSPSHLVSPSPSPSPTIEAETPAPAPAPVPVLHVRANPHPPSHRSSSFIAHHKTQEQGRDKNRVRTIIVAVIASATAALVCALGLIFLCNKRGKQRKKPTRITSVHGKKRESRGNLMNASTQNSGSSTVSENPGLDLFYLNTLGTDLEQQSYCLKQTSESVNTSPYQSISKCTFHEIQEGNKELSQLTKVQSDNASSSSTREITSLHEDAESIKYESDGGNSSSGDNVIPIECHSSDDESFHSFGESFCSNVRLSNASAGSLGEASDIFSPQESRLKASLASSLDIQMRAAIQDVSSSQDSAPPPQSPCKSILGKLGVEWSSDCQKLMKHQSPPPRPPLPPPPPPTMTYSPPSSTRNASKASLSFTLPNLSSPGTLDSSSGTNRISQIDLPSSPQNAPAPSRASSRIPPPPCPPLFLKGNNSSAKCPPPPPSQALQFTPVGKDGAPLAKLKPLHWDKVRAASDRSTVWDKLRSSSFELNEEMIESLFGYNLQYLKGDEAKSKTPSPSKHVLDPKRLQNITILSKALNATAEQVCEALVQGNGLCLQQLEALVKMVPTKEEEAKLSSYKGEINELGSAEKFVKVILAIPFAFLRAEAMLYRETFEDEVVHLRNSFSMLEEACKELRSSRLFLKLLEAVLKTGNRMNVGTIRGGARAFKLDALLKLADVKGTDGKTTLLHFVVQEIIRSEGIRVSDSIMGRISQKKKTKTVEEREEDYRRMGLELVSGLSTELYNVKKTATIDLDVLASSVSCLSDGMTKLQHLVQKDLCPNEQNGNFVNSMRSFLNYAEKNLKDLQGDEDRVLKHVKEITEYFHGDVSKDEVNPLRIFVIVRDFLGMLDNVCKELRSSKAPRSPNPLAPFR